MLRGSGSIVAINLALACASCAPRPTSVERPAPLPTLTGAADGDQRIAELGTCALESGEKIEGCRIGYRTFGKLDPAKSNAILFPTWFTGTTKSLLDVVPDKLVDTKRFHLILVDAIGDGVSSSPSNSRAQPRLKFPKFTIRDMVESQRRLLREVLGITRLHTVMGISMGGMQALEWSVAHPDEVGRSIPIVGTPQLTSQDLLLWNAELHALEGDAAFANGEYQGHPRMRAVQDIHWLMLSTPAHRASETTREAFPQWLESKESDTAFDWNDWHRQLEAMLVHDIAHGGRLEDAAQKVKAKTMVVVAEHDHMVNPGPAKAFAKAANAKLVVLDGPCGHLIPSCEPAVVAQHVRAFLSE
jgi:homoserine O-acetyltransferase/O-succinyltransferase